jgi:hypothetical protein
MPGPPQFRGALSTNIRNTKSPHWRGWLKPANDNLALRINAVNLKNRLGDVETDCRDRLHAGSSNCEGLNSTHICGTHVPVEEVATSDTKFLIVRRVIIRFCKIEMKAAHLSIRPVL